MPIPKLEIISTLPEQRRQPTLFDLPKPGRVKAPMLIIGAANDQIFSPAEIQATAAAYGTTARIFADMAHDIMLERSWRDAATFMLAWLADRGI